MTDHVERLQGAVTVLAGHGHIKQRLIRAFEEYLAVIEEDELPIALKQDFADLKASVNGVAPLNGEGPICASVRKMSVEEASECAAMVVSLFGDLAKYGDISQKHLPLQDDVGDPIPPFLVKTS